MVVRSIINNLLRAFVGVDRFDVGIRLSIENDSALDDDQMQIRHVDCSQLTSIKFLKYLQAMNVQNNHIYFRPSGKHRFTLIDDVFPEKLGWAESEGYQACVVVETSPDNFQLWLDHGAVLNEQVSTQASKYLADIFDGDPSSADWRHFGRLPGFTNPKPKYRKNGQKPFSKLINARNRIYDQSSFVVELAECRQQDIENERVERANRIRSLQSNSNNGNSNNHKIKTWDCFYNNPKYDFDLHRVDLVYAIYALSHGMSDDDVRQQILCRDLSHKGGAGRQLDYVERTIAKAYQYQK